MSKAWARQRARLFAADPMADTSTRPLSRSTGRNTDMVGRDLARLRSRGRRTAVPWLVIALGAVAAALLLASLRVSILRLRYELTAGVTEETRLLERQRAATVELRELRDPTRLRHLATELGLARPQRVIQLSVPATGIGETAP